MSGKFENACGVVRDALLFALVTGVLGLAGCEQKKAPSVTNERSQAVLGTATATATAAAATAMAPATASTAPKKRGPLCAGQMEKSGRDLPRSAISRAAAPDASEPPSTIPTSGGKWTWINFWAAWCVPCKEEMPRLKGWEQKLTKPFRLVFVSLDDDERQLRDFLAAQPPSGVRSTYWLKDGKEREQWLDDVGIEKEPELPAHILVDPRGKARCVIHGAMEDADYSEVVKLLGG